MKKKNTDNKRKQSAALILVSVFCTLLLIAYLYHHASMGVISTSSYFNQMKTWVAKERAYLSAPHHASPKKPAKSIAINQDSDHSPIRFEFYHALPTMQVSIPRMAFNENSEDKPQSDEKSFKKVVKKEKKVASSKLFDAETLKRELSRDLETIK